MEISIGSIFRVEINILEVEKDQYWQVVGLGVLQE